MLKTLKNDLEKQIITIEIDGDDYELLLKLTEEYFLTEPLTLIAKAISSLNSTCRNDTAIKMGVNPEWLTPRGKEIYDKAEKDEEYHKRRVAELKAEREKRKSLSTMQYIFRELKKLFGRNKN